MMSVTTAWTRIWIRRSGTSSSMGSGMWSAICISSIMTRCFTSGFGTFGYFNFNPGAMKFFILQWLEGSLDTFFFGIFDKSKASWDFARASINLVYYPLLFGSIQTVAYSIWPYFSNISFRSASVTFLDKLETWRHNFSICW